MDRNTDPEALAECVAPLDDECREVLQRYWDRVIEEVWAVLPAKPVPSPASMTEWAERRERREARRAMARIAAAGRIARVHVLPAPRRASVSGAGEAA
ncbi:MAG: hypothetical protein AB7L91_16805 [Dehalococcoidia bacterium]